MALILPPAFPGWILLLVFGPWLLILLAIAMTSWNSRDRIRAFIHPEDWFEGNWISPDSGQIYSELIRRDPAAYYQIYEDGLYWLTDTKGNRSSTRSGRVESKWWYIGDPDPLDLLTGEKKGTAGLLKRLEEEKMTGFFELVNGLTDLLKNPLLWIVMIGGGFLLAITIIQGQNKQSCVDMVKAMQPVAKSFLVIFLWQKKK